jgi:hypothetical protein
MSPTVRALQARIDAAAADTHTAMRRQTGSSTACFAAARKKQKGNIKYGKNKEDSISRISGSKQE